MNRTNASLVGASSANATIEAFFQRVADSGLQPRLRNVTGVCQFNIEGAGTWRVAIKKGVFTVTRGESGDPTLPNCIISSSAHDFLRLIRREDNLNIYAASLQEILTISGDIPFAWTILGSFIVNPAEALTR